MTVVGKVGGHKHACNLPGAHVYDCGTVWRCDECGKYWRLVSDPMGRGWQGMIQWLARRRYGANK